MRLHPSTKKLKKIFKIDIIPLFLFVIFLIVAIKFFNWFDEHGGGVQAISTIVLAFVTGYFAWKSYKLEQIRVRQPHSKRIAEEIGEGIQNQSFIDDLEDLKWGDLWFDNFVKDGDKIFSFFSNLSLYTKQHLEDGYPDLYKKYENWINIAKSFFKKFEDFIKRAMKDLDEWVEGRQIKYEKLTKVLIIRYCLQKIMNPSFQEPHEEPRGEFVRISVIKEGIMGILMEGELKSWKAIKEEFISKFIISEKEEVLKINEEFKRLSKERKAIMEEIKLKIVDVGMYNGLLEGKCDICKGLNV
jgi:hypothetical protein